MTLNRETLLTKYLGREFTRTATSLDAIAPTPRESAVPVSFEQRQQWHLASLTPDVPLYHECVTLHLPGPLDVAALARAFGEIIRRHEAWRTSFPIVDGEPVQRVHPARDVRLPLVDLRGLPQPVRETEAWRLAVEEARQPFDLANGPLLRATLVRLGDTAHDLYATFHTIIVDCSCLVDVFLPELHALYDAFRTGEPPSLPALPIQYADYAYWQRHWLQGDDLANHLTYWKHRLHDAPSTLALQTARPRLPVQTYNGGFQPFALPEDLSNAIKSLSRREGVSLFMTLVAAFAVLLYRASGQTDLVVGTASSTNRMRPEFHGLLGRMMNTLALRIDLAGNPSFLEVLRRVRGVTGEAYSHQDAPFDLVVNALQAEHDTDHARHHALFSAMLLVEPPPCVLESGWTFAIDAKTNTSKCDLSLVVSDGSEGLAGRWEYNTDLFDETTISQMRTAWQGALVSVVTDPAQRLADLQLPLPVVALPHTSAAVTDLAQGMACSIKTTAEAPVAATVTSRAVVQEQLLQIWEELLPVRPIGMGDNFFDLGGHSLLAARMLQRIEEECGTRIPLTALFEGATIEQLAHHVLQSTPTDDPSYSLMAINTSGHQRPLFFLHGGGTGNGLWCANIARALGPDQPFYGIPPVPFEDLPPSRVFEAMARAHLEQVRTIQPQGPYRLGGYCNGGLLAYEMAQQLLAQGHDVELLVLLEPVAVYPMHKLLYTWISTVGASLGLSASQQAATYVGLQLLKAHLLRAVYRTAAQRRTLVQQSERGSWPRLVSAALSHLKAIPPSREEIRGDWFGWYSWAKAEYIPRRYYPGRLTVLWTAEEATDELGAPSIATRMAQWHNMATAQEMEECIVPGTRLTCRTDHVHALAAQFVRCCSVGGA